jgi:hypothetical protein
MGADGDSLQHSPAVPGIAGNGLRVHSLPLGLTGACDALLVVVPRLLITFYCQSVIEIETAPTVLVSFDSTLSNFCWLLSGRIRAMMWQLLEVDVPNKADACSAILAPVSRLMIPPPGSEVAIVVNSFCSNLFLLLFSFCLRMRAGS